jgi:hypothetical protein
MTHFLQTWDYGIWLFISAVSFKLCPHLKRSNVPTAWVRNAQYLLTFLIWIHKLIKKYGNWMQILLSVSFPKLQTSWRLMTFRKHGMMEHTRISGMMIDRGNRSTWRKPAPVSLDQPQTPHACLDANLEHRGRKPVINRLNYGTALFHVLLFSARFPSKWYIPKHLNHLTGPDEKQMRYHLTVSSILQQQCNFIILIIPLFPCPSRG